ncbi:uncharacterized protein F4822DRAFT_429980 [Hypoxylon trugodes]|uniref:uncharacterized protein n=1 Tax=Hypoxylon trugodes TaxID=326681 RepID=UPI0021937D87|nr:uncharacterized protein F4822DRAFT_429980 [Hypoxylon trugodes]KAI1387225.1 hypothetical protein F4822DRAFT_429980 [Hypoxylon trugodes]
MLFNTKTILSAVTLLMANQAMGAIAGTQVQEARAVATATDPNLACNCPNNCDYGPGHSCAYYTDPSNSRNTAKGTCQEENGSLTCVVNS